MWFCLLPLKGGASLIEIWILVVSCFQMKQFVLNVTEN